MVIDRAEHVGIHASQLQPSEARPTLCLGRCSLDPLPLLRPRMVGAVRPQRPPLVASGISVGQRNLRPMGPIWSTWSCFP